MPTYVCHVRSGALDAEGKTRVAEEITRVHHEVTGAPHYYVQVLFADVSLENQFVGGRRPQAAEAWVRGDIRAGRSGADRARLITGLVRGVSLASDIPEPNIWVYLAEHPPENMAEFGVRLPEPGGEQAWLAALPEANRDHLSEFDPGQVP